MRKSLIIVLIILILLTSYVVFIRKSSSVIDEFSFKLADTSIITRIQLADSTAQVTIKKIDEQWMVNNTFHANQNLVRQFLRIFMNLEISLLVPEAETDSINNILAQNGVKLSFYIGEKITREFIIGQFDKEKEATLITNDDQVAAYLIAPGLSRNIRKFIETDPLFWRDKQLFNFSSDEISHIYFKDNVSEKNSFKIRKDKDNFMLYDNDNKQVNFDNKKLMRYLSYFGNLKFESLATELDSKNQDSVIIQTSIYVIEASSVSGLNTKLELFSKKDSTQADLKDVNFVYGILNAEKHILLIRYFEIDPILKSIRYFE